jgi:hypothetical protein
MELDTEDARLLGLIIADYRERIPGRLKIAKAPAHRERLMEAEDRLRGLAREVQRYERQARHVTS